MRLERVTGIHQAAYVRMVEDFEAAGEEFSFNDAATAREDFARFVADLDDEAAGRNLPPGCVAQTTYVLVDDAVGEGPGGLDGSVVAEFRYRPTAGEPWTRHHGHVGYDVRPSMRRRGYATAGLRLLIRRAAADGLPGLVLTIAPDNIASRRVAEANGAFLRTPAAEAAEPDGEDLWWLPVLPAATP